MTVITYRELSIKYPEVLEWGYDLDNAVDWYSISVWQNLSEPFIREFKDRVRLNPNSWLYASDSVKLEFIKTKTDYEIVDNDTAIIAYKSCRSDESSYFNYQYKYETGKSYESHCDCNLDNDNSFGLSAWTKEKAIEYCNEKLFKVKIKISDIGAIVQDFNKIRCFKLEILEEVK